MGTLVTAAPLAHQTTAIAVRRCQRPWGWSHDRGSHRGLSGVPAIQAAPAPATSAMSGAGHSGDQDQRRRAEHLCGRDDEDATHGCSRDRSGRGRPSGAGGGDTAERSSHAPRSGASIRRPTCHRGDETEHTHEGDVMQELCSVAAAAVVHHAADTFEREQQRQRPERGGHSSPHDEDEHHRGSNDIGQRCPHVDVLLQEPAVAQLAIREPCRHPVSVSAAAAGCCPPRPRAGCPMQRRRRTSPRWESNPRPSAYKAGGSAD